MRGTIKMAGITSQKKDGDQPKKTDGQFWANIIWRNIDEALNSGDETKSLSWLAENCGFVSKFIYYNRNKMTDFSMSILVRIANVLKVNVSDLISVPMAQLSSSRYLIETEEPFGEIKRSNYLFFLSSMIPKLSVTRQKAVLETVLSFYDTSLEEIREGK